RPFEEVRDELAREQAQADRERAFSDLTGRLTDLVYQNPSSLEPAARELGLEVRTLGPFSREDTIGIAASPEVKRAAFSEMLIEDGTASDPIEIGPQHSVLIRVLEHEPAAARPLAEVRAEVEAAVRADRRAKAAVAAAEAALERLRAGEALAAVAGADAQLMPLSGLPRGAPAPSPEANRAIFGASGAPGSKGGAPAGAPAAPSAASSGCRSKKASSARLAPGTGARSREVRALSFCGSGNRGGTGSVDAQLHARPQDAVGGEVVEFQQPAYRHAVAAGDGPGGLAAADDVHASRGRGRGGARVRIRGRGGGTHRVQGRRRWRRDRRDQGQRRGAPALRQRRVQAPQHCRVLAVAQCPGIELAGAFQLARFKGQYRPVQAVHPFRLVAGAAQYAGQRVELVHVGIGDGGQPLQRAWRGFERD